MEYFGALPIEKISKELHKKIRSYYNHLSETGHLRKIKKAYEMYYGIGENDTSRTHEGGEDGEKIEIRVNHLRSLLSHILVLTTQNRPALKAVAINSDYKSQASSKLGDSLIDYYFRDKNLDRVVKDATEISLLTTLAYVIFEWNPNEGQEYGVNENGAVIYDGDIEATAKSCLEIVKDIYEETPSWYIIRKLKNKHDLAASYPELKEKILNFFQC